MVETRSATIAWGWVPNALTLARVALTALAWAVVLRREIPAFVVLVLVIVLTDILDGPLARRLGSDGAEGANFDSASDFLFYSSLPLWTYLLRPAEIAPLLPAILAFAALYLAALAWAGLRRGQIGFHNRFTRTATTYGVLFAVWTILWGLSGLLLAGLAACLVVDLYFRFRNTMAASPRPRSPGSHRPSGPGREVGSLARGAHPPDERPR